MIDAPALPRLYPEHIIRRVLEKHEFDGQKCLCGADLAGYLGKTPYKRWLNHVVHNIREKWKNAYRAPDEPRGRSLEV